MSYFSIRDFIESGRKSLIDKNYWSALSVALALPSMCSRLQYQDNPDYYDINGKTGEKHWHDRKCYIDFCNTAFNVNNNQPDGFLSSVIGVKYPELLYSLRCDIIHAGIANVFDDDKGLYLSLGDTSSTDFTKYRSISIKDLCNTIFDHIETWCCNTGYENLRYTFVFDTDSNRDDRLLYQRLCDNARADYLEEKFEQEHKERIENADNRDKD